MLSKRITRLERSKNQLENNVTELNKLLQNRDSLIEDKSRKLSDEIEAGQNQRAIYEQTLATLHEARLRESNQSAQDMRELKNLIRQLESSNESKQKLSSEQTHEIESLNSLVDKLTTINEELQKDRDIHALSAGRLLPEKDDAQHEAIKAAIELEHLTKSMNNFRTKSPSMSTS
eukprot:808602_1